MNATRRGAAAALVALTMSVAACGTGGGSSAPQGSAGPSITPAPGAIRIVTTTTVFADIVRAVGGSRTDVRSIIPPGVGPEDYEPKPDDAKSLADAQLIVSNGVGLDDFLNRLLASGSGGNTPGTATPTCAAARASAPGTASSAAARIPCSPSRVTASSTKP
ncbi:MAG: manganese/iron transport system substrate-binding protein, partial [Chloroflexota bacterium]|nr:manganese/iron transport system substrate-binding protein [Chloroflexota bacterium]